MTKPVRISIQPTTDNPDAPPICIDLVLSDHNEIVGRHVLFGMQGWFGDRALAECFPFTLNANGRIDFGSGYLDDPNERYGELNLRDDAVSIGRLLTLDSINYGIQHFRIDRIESLA